jgi:sulfite exporter TauE/SafE/copper chaperone CopZ
MSKTIQFQAEVHDESCGKLIKQEVREIGGIKEITIDGKTGEGRVTFDQTRTGTEEILSAIRKTGHECSEIEPIAKETKTTTITFHANGMHCPSCERIIGRQGEKVDGVKEIRASYRTGECAVTFDPSKTDAEEIFAAIAEKGYECSQIPASGKTTTNWLGIISAVMGILLVTGFALFISDRIPVPEITRNMSYSLIFVLGLLTGLHCIAMCGGFVISYTARDVENGRKPHKSHLLYAVGKLASYTLIGAFFGLVGSIVAFTPLMRGVIGIIAGLFLILFGLKTLNVFPTLRRLTFTPRFISKFVGETGAHSGSNPLVIGLLNGLMLACGPLQAMYVMAAGTGSFVEGGKLLFLFGLGTLPLMIGFGYLAGAFTSKLTHQILKASGAVVIILGVLMLNNGLALTGTGYDFRSLTSAKFGSNSYSAQAGGSKMAPKFNGQIAVLKDGYQEIRMDVTYAGYVPSAFMLKKGVPVKWIINGKEITSCNGGIIVPKYNLNFKIKSGEQTIEFTPDSSGPVSWSCWMGMIPGTFVIVDDLSSPGNVTIPIAKASGGSCGMGAGCGCGMGTGAN